MPSALANIALMEVFTLGASTCCTQCLPELLLSRFSCPTLCDPIDSSPPGSAIPGILQARTLEWVAISFSNAWRWKVKVKSFSPVQLWATPWTIAYQAPLSMGFSRQEYWSGVPLSSRAVLTKYQHTEIHIILFKSFPLFFYLYIPTKVLC